MPPLGHFTLTDGDVARYFIGTGTGFAPLYFQILSALSRGDRSEMLLVF
ncbi:MAG TPA: hypothetical protein PK765_02835 [bacterium]|nr:hypothetical protein [bacterium]